jgi:hypothetical protein
MSHGFVLAERACARPDAPRRESLTILFGMRQKTAALVGSAQEACGLLPLRSYAYDRYSTATVGRRALRADVRFVAGTGALRLAR